MDTFIRQYSTSKRKMQHRNTTTSSSSDNTNLIILTCTGMFLILGIGIMIGHFWHKNKRHAYTDDLGVCHALLSKDPPRRYSKFPPSFHEAVSQDREIRRMIRREQLRDDIEGVYRISVRRMEDDEVSLSSDGSFLDGEERSAVDSKESENEVDSSESKDASSDDSDDSNNSEDSDEAGGMRELMKMRRPALPKSVSQLRARK